MPSQQAQEAVRQLKASLQKTGGYITDTLHAEQIIQVQMEIYLKENDKCPSCEANVDKQKGCTICYGTGRGNSAFKSMSGILLGELGEKYRLRKELNHYKTAPRPSVDFITVFAPVLGSIAAYDLWHDPSIISTAFAVICVVMSLFLIIHSWILPLYLKVKTFKKKG